MDDNADSRALQRENVEALGLTGATRIWRRDATDLGPLGPRQRRAVQPGVPGPALSQGADPARR